VLENTGKCKKATFFAQHVTDLLDQEPILLAAKNILQPCIKILLVFNVPLLVLTLLSKGKPAFGDIMVVKIVQCGGADVLVLFFKKLASDIVMDVFKNGLPFGPRRAMSLPRK
jgi:hypothetical protein